MRASPLLINSALLHLIATLPVLVVAGGQECYVCIPGEQTPAELQRQFPGEELAQCGGDLPPAKKCPDNYRGCLTQHNNGLMTRSCGELNITTCNSANGVYYCYCSGRLCNGPENDKQPPPPPPPVAGEGEGGREPPLDDEDALSGEGSGVGGAAEETSPTTTRTPTTRTPPTSTPGQHKRTTSEAAHLKYHLAIIPAALFIQLLF